MAIERSAVDALPTTINNYANNHATHFIKNKISSFNIHCGSL
jgi:hypothetical protein